MRILGIWDGHDSGAAIIENGHLVAAINEERLSRRKLEVQYPERAVRCCLEIADLASEDVDVVACSTSDVAKALARWFPRTKEAYYQVRRRKTSPGHLSSVKKRAKYWITEWGPNPITKSLSLAALRKAIARNGLENSQLKLYDHHSAHAATAGFSSGMDPCLVITIDGVGDGLSASVSLLEDGRMKRLAATPARHSPGIFFEHVTNLMNMRELEDEGKVMALADHTFQIPDADNPCLDIVTVRGLTFHTSRPGHALAAELRDVQWRYPNEQFAYLAQRTVELRGAELVRNAVLATGISSVALAGGVASNVKMNRRIASIPEVEDVFVFPHMGDGGLAVGAAILASQECGEELDLDLNDLGTGPGYSNLEIESSLISREQSFTKPQSLCRAVAELIEGGKVVLWFQGRMEYGPRALGHRSALARPDKEDIRDRLNMALKRRAWFQPFCPSMLESAARLALDDNGQTPNRHMTMAYGVRPEFRHRLAGVTSVDGSCRPQIVADTDEGRYATLLRAVRERLGFGAVLNTSYNIHGEPIVCSPSEGVDVFLRSGADALAIGDYLVLRSSVI